MMARHQQVVALAVVFIFISSHEMQSSFVAGFAGKELSSFLPAVAPPVPGLSLERLFCY